MLTIFYYNAHDAIFMTTPYHARYFAHELTRHYRGSGVGTALFNACVKLNPHQVDAALFALRNPLSSGVVLADEVGLGTTIEAGLVLCQMWAERRRRLLVVCPASLRKQWSLELTEKFNLPNVVIGRCRDLQAGWNMSILHRPMQNSQHSAAASIAAPRSETKHGPLPPRRNWA
jgi:N12 class adenine-specific DNA methylase